MNRLKSTVSILVILIIFIILIFYPTDAWATDDNGFTINVEEYDEDGVAGIYDKFYYFSLANMTEEMKKITNIRWNVGYGGEIISTSKTKCSVGSNDGEFVLVAASYKGKIIGRKVCNIC